MLKKIAYTLAGGLLLALLPSLATPSNAQDDVIPNIYAWLYLDTDNTLALVGPGGQLTRQSVPTTEDELDGMRPYFAVSPDGDTLVKVSATDDFRPLVIFWNPRTDKQMSWRGEPDYLVLGPVGADYSLAPLSFSPDGSQFALGVGNPDAQSWEVVVFDVASAAPQAKLDASNPQLVGTLMTLPQAPSYIVPIVRWHEGERVHVQLVTADALGLREYPSVAWSLADGSVTLSTYDRALMAIDPASGAMLYPFNDPDQPSVESMLSAPNNALRMDDETLYVSPQNIANVTWLSQDALLFQTENIDTFQQVWALLRLDGGDAEPQVLPDVVDVQGALGGYVSIMQNREVVYMRLAAPSEGTLLTTLADNGPGGAEIIWASWTGGEYDDWPAP